MSACRARIGLRQPCIWLALAVLGIGTPIGAHATARSAAEQAVRAYFGTPGARVVAQAAALNPRLRLAPCGVPLTAKVPDGVRAMPQVSVPVSCRQTPQGWTIRVPVHLQVFRQVLVTTHALRRGDGIHADDVRSEERDVARLGYGYLDQPDQLADRTLARALPAGSVLTPAALGGRTMVRAGDRVQMVAQLGDIVVRADGVALGSGDNGTRLRVRNGSSGTIVDGVVSGPGVVRTLP
ncbi:MAG: flagellar basal body P-ring formation protein FlgA [Rhodanobacter sp.]|nr:MAG: flagellar basal body P-ring formation protein FlgA [Rhodanobacter sp.]TAM13988.1 MAG: flagellar basal body P-ring formation protein FlgA [Rhodanobacter sp.]TAM37135.1 MAG: flagellar basal body P-ring formation protein FlgA [Rhodanobacter sp.]